MQLPGLQRKKRFLGRKSAAKACKLSVRADHAVAWHHDRQGIRSVGGPDSSRCLRISDAPGQFSVGNRFAVWDLLQPLPDGLLKVRAFGSQRQIEVAPP